MSFEKKILILSQITNELETSNKRASGILRIENENGVSTLFLSTVNFGFESNGEYFLFLIVEDKTLSFSLGERPSSYTFFLDAFLSFDKEISAGIVLSKDCFPQVVAFAGKREEKSIAFFKKKVYDKFLTEMKKNKEEKEDFTPHFPNSPDFPLPKPFPSTGSPKFPDIDPLNPNNVKKQDYDDEVVATENYFEMDDLSEKLKIIENLSKNVSTQNGVSDFFSQEETQKNENQPDFNTNEGCQKTGRKTKKFGPENPYYLTKKTELDQIFEKFPKEEDLSRINSLDKWAKITYAKDKFYVVGLIFLEGKEKYICYGIPGSYSKTPPKELKGFCTFIPISVFDLNGKGYWMTFQDAVTGEHVEKLN